MHDQNGPAGFGRIAPALKIEVEDIAHVELTRTVASFRIEAYESDQPVRVLQTHGQVTIRAGKPFCDLTDLFLRSGPWMIIGCEIGSLILND